MAEILMFKTFKIWIGLKTYRPRKMVMFCQFSSLNISSLKFDFVEGINFLVVGNY